MPPIITEIETTEFTYPLENVTTNPVGTDVVYERADARDDDVRDPRPHRCGG